MSGLQGTNAIPPWSIGPWHPENMHVGPWYPWNDNPPQPSVFQLTSPAAPSPFVPQGATTPSIWQNFAGVATDPLAGVQNVDPGQAMKPWPFFNAVTHEPTPLGNSAMAIPGAAAHAGAQFMADWGLGADPGTSAPTGAGMGGNGMAPPAAPTSPLLDLESFMPKPQHYHISAPPSYTPEPPTDYSKVQSLLEQAAPDPNSALYKSSPQDRAMFLLSAISQAGYNPKMSLGQNLLSIALGGLGGEAAYRKDITQKEDLLAQRKEEYALKAAGVEQAISSDQTKQRRDDSRYKAELDREAWKMLMPKVEGGYAIQTMPSKDGGYDVNMTPVKTGENATMMRMMAMSGLMANTDPVAAIMANNVPGATENDLPLLNSARAEIQQRLAAKLVDPKTNALFPPNIYTDPKSRETAMIQYLLPSIRVDMMNDPQRGPALTAMLRQVGQLLEKQQMARWMLSPTTAGKKPNE